MLKKMLPTFLSLSILMGSSIPDYARTVDLKDIKEPINTINLTSNLNSNLKFLEVSESRKIYTFNREGKNYKYIDNIKNKNKAVTEKYVEENGNYKLFDEVSYELRDNKFKISSNIKGTNEILNLNEVFQLKLNNKQAKELSVNTRARSSYSWQYITSSRGNTEVRNISITANVMILSSVIGSLISKKVPGALVGGLGAVAAYLFDKKMHTAYYQIDTYKDRNSPKLRPVFRYGVTWYTDATYKHKITTNTDYYVVGKAGTHG